MTYKSSLSSCSFLKKSAENAAKLWGKALKASEAQAQSVGAQQNTITQEGDGEVRYKLKDNDSIKTQINAASDTLNNMDSVADITVNEEFTTKKAAVDWATSVLRPTGYQVDRQNFGAIRFDRNDINNGMNYVNTREEAAAFAALPKVLKRGIEISQHSAHKGRKTQLL